MDTLYKDLQYYIWCLEMEKNPKLCESKRKYEEFIVSDLVKNHKGDCTLDNFSCSRCQIQDIEIKAQNILDCLIDDYDIKTRELL